MSRTVTILGSTGSIGKSTLRVVRSFPDEFTVYGITCRSNLETLGKQIEEFHPAVVVVESDEVYTSDRFDLLRRSFPAVEFLRGWEGLVELASRPVDIVVSAIVGAAGLRPSLAAIGKAKRIALANKETLVMAGEIFMRLVEEAGTELIPVDSEHSAIFSLLAGNRREDVHRLIITASGGSLRSVPIDDLSIVTPEDALMHPTWSMGSKITIDSATLMNKGLEVMEAHHLFAFPYDRIDVIIHPESVVHSMIETVDGALYAHLGVADMALPILNAMKYPDKVRNEFGAMNMAKLSELHFKSVDHARYPALALAIAAGRTGGTMPAVLNAANEVAVHAFLAEKIHFTDIVPIVEKTMEKHTVTHRPTLDDIFAADREARTVSELILKGEIL